MHQVDIIVLQPPSHSLLSRCAKLDRPTDEGKALHLKLDLVRRGEDMTTAFASAAAEVEEWLWVDFRQSVG